MSEPKLIHSFPKNLFEEIRPYISSSSAGNIRCPSLFQER